MINLYFRNLWRLLIFVLGILLAFGVVDKAVPYLNKHLPIGLVFLVVYLLVAYAGIPTLIRLWRIVIKPNHIPVYITTGDGWASDPINVALVVSSKKKLIRSFQEAGWSTADRSSIKNLIRGGYAILFQKTYKTAPMSRLFLFNRSQDIGFQLQDGETPSPRHRHHVRLWRLDTSSTDDGDHHTFWHDLMQLFKKNRSEIWIGSATHDIAPIAFRMRNLQLTHKIDSDTNKERDFLIETLRSSNQIKSSVEEISSGHALKFKGQTFGVNIIVDGKLKVVRLKK